MRKLVNLAELRENRPDISDIAELFVQITLLFLFLRKIIITIILLLFVTKLTPTITERQRYYISLIDNDSLSITNLNLTTSGRQGQLYLPIENRQCPLINSLSNMSNSRRICTALQEAINKNFYNACCV
jgi:hypothetical protein